MQELNKLHEKEKAQKLDLVSKEEVQKWLKALESLDTEGERWKFVLLDVPIVNAFVSEVTPYTIYVTSALMKHVVSNDDELAVILGHELSHLLLAHSSDSMTMQRNLNTLEVVCFHC